MADEWKMRAIMTTSAIILICITAIAIRQCNDNDTTTRHIAVGTALRDSLLNVSPAGCRHISYQGFEVWFDTLRHIPACVTYELTIGHLNGTFHRTDRFERDYNVAGCPDPNAYAGTGLHRGHMAPASDMAWDSTAIRQSFMMTNICPQHRSLNEGGWARLEEKCREWVQRDSALIIATGPIIEPGMEFVGKTDVALPKRFYKVILAHCIAPKRALAFIYDNAPCNGRLKRYASTIDEVERLTGIDFFSCLTTDEQEQIESACNLQVWLH